jgi:hypothetical protein
VDHARGALNGISPQSRKLGHWFWIDESREPIPEALSKPAADACAVPRARAERIRAAKSPENASELWITR